MMAVGTRRPFRNFGFPLAIRCKADLDQVAVKELHVTGTPRVNRCRTSCRNPLPFCSRGAPINSECGRDDTDGRELPMLA